MPKRPDKGRRLAVYPGTFDPITNGHVDILRRALTIFDRGIVAVAALPHKQMLFDLKERLEMVTAAVSHLPDVAVESFDSLLVEFLKTKGACVAVRGLRAVSDFEYEFQMTLLNRRQCPEIETVFLTATEEYTFLTSSAIRELASYGGALDSLVPPLVAQKLREHYRR